MFKFRLACLLSLLLVNPAQAFDSFEHNEIGNEGFAAAIKKLDRGRRGQSSRLLSGKNLSKGSEPISAVANGKEIAKFTFGDLVSIYGDYAVTFDDINSPSMINRVANLKNIVRGGNLSDFENELNHNINLAVNNPTHFSGRAAQTYVRWHRQALILAPQKGRLWEALHYEALALHSFTDLYAFGHMHDNREFSDRLTQWGKEQKQKNGFFASSGTSMAKSASKVMGGYTNFYHNAYNWKGGMMMNLAGDVWRGFGDKKYRVVDAGCPETTKVGKRKCRDTATERQREIIVHAVSVSILDVLKAASGKRAQVGKEYTAMCHLPVKYWNSSPPIAPESQKIAIVQMAGAMEKQGRPLAKNGFDFNLGFLKFKKGEMRGEVNYIDYVRQYCGM